MEYSRNCTQRELPSSKTYGEANQLKVTTKYRIEEEASEVDEDIQQRLYTALQEYLPADLTLAQFVKGGSSDDKVGILEYNKVGPTIADDISNLTLSKEIFIEIGKQVTRSTGTEI